MKDQLDPEIFATREALEATEGNEPDDAPAAGVLESAAAAETDPSFEDFIGSLGLRHFSASEFLFRGGSNSSGACRDKNGPPPRSLWPNIVNTAHVLDALRGKLGYSIRLTSIYRNQSYNSCIGGEPASYHMRFNACDFQGSQEGPRAWADALLKMRSDGIFRGGVGLYSTFVHVDTRGHNASWGF